MVCLETVRELCHTQNASHLPPPTQIPWTYMESIIHLKEYCRISLILLDYNDSENLQLGQTSPIHHFLSSPSFFFVFPSRCFYHDLNLGTKGPRFNFLKKKLNFFFFCIKCQFMNTSPFKHRKV